MKLIKVTKNKSKVYRLKDNRIGIIYNSVIATSGSAFSVTGTTPSFSSTAITEPVVRLPASVHKTYAVEVEGATIVNEICVGDSMDELRTV